MDAETETPSFSKYMGWIFAPFFRWWWAGLTGTASLLGFYWTPELGLNLTRAEVCSFIFVFLLFAFLMMSSIMQGWRLYFRQQSRLQVVTVRKAPEFDADLLFVIDGYLRETRDTLLEIRRVIDNAEVPFCIARVINTTDAGYAQAVSFWTSPGHLRAFSRHEFSAHDLRVTSTLSHDRIREAINATN